MDYYFSNQMMWLFHPWLIRGQLQTLFWISEAKTRGLGCLTGFFVLFLHMSYAYTSYHMISLDDKNVRPNVSWFCTSPTGIPAFKLVSLQLCAAP